MQIICNNISYYREIYADLLPLSQHDDNGHIVTSNTVKPQNNKQFLTIHELFSISKKYKKKG